METENCLVLLTFPNVMDNRQIKSEQFLNAAVTVLNFVRQLGVIFKPIEADLNGNISTLKNILNTDSAKFEIIASFQETDTGRNALLWLKRALKFINLLLVELLRDFQSGECVDDLTSIMKIAYENSLRKYHSWFTQQVVNVCLNAAPNRSELLQCLAKFIWKFNT
ncbi:Glycolipid transfer protein-like protein [Leptotrombidium deliense]|uniref:Glycolipid transfer protein-like protein n=1 Tax=Leptotrombidium deliense TaxID=299467 RepID=A0A443RYK7_9ACAR|nr:Glycolipid transfer protein-like protein [Leptotrombidium deliense]